MYGSQSVLRFSLRLHYHTGCSYRVIKFVLSVFRSLNTMSEKQAAAAIIIALLKKKEKKEIEAKKKSLGEALA